MRRRVREPHLLRRTRHAKGATISNADHRLASALPPTGKRASAGTSVTARARPGIVARQPSSDPDCEVPANKPLPALRGDHFTDRERARDVPVSYPEAAQALSRMTNIPAKELKPTPGLEPGTPSLRGRCGVEPPCRIPRSHATFHRSLLAANRCVLHSRATSVRPQAHRNGCPRHGGGSQIPVFARSAQSECRAFGRSQERGGSSPKFPHQSGLR